jgi:ubiquinone/menaquinone biosynthesis C-methylase UbiE
MRFSFDRVADIYSEVRRPLPDFVYDCVHEKISEQKRYRGGDPVRYLDLATGTGTLIRNIHPMANVDMRGIDISWEMLEQARRLPSKNEVKFDLGDVHQIPCPDESIDMVSCCQAIHLFAPNLFYDEIKRVLAPHGTFIIVTYDLIAAMGSPARYTNEIFRSMLAHDMWPGFSETGIHPDLLDQLEEYGFLPFETASKESVFSFSAEEWQRRIESSSLSLKIVPEAVRRALLEEHCSRLDGFFLGRALSQRQRCWVVVACRRDYAEHVIPSAWKPF